MNLPPKDIGCHRTGFEKGCLELVASGRCNRWVTLEGKNPVNGQDMNRSDCVDNWPIVLLIDIAAKTVNGTGGIQKATESFRNAMLEMNGVLPRSQLTLPREDNVSDYPRATEEDSGLHRRG